MFYKRKKVTVKKTVEKEMRVKITYDDILITEDTMPISQIVSTFTEEMLKCGHSTILVESKETGEVILFLEEEIED